MTKRSTTKKNEALAAAKRLRDMLEAMGLDCASKLDAVIEALSE
jgi:hypothetical protein